MKRNNIIIIFLFLIISLHGFTDETGNPEIGKTVALSVREAVDLALKNNLTIASERIGLVTKKRVKDNTWNYFIPEISLSGTLSRQNEAPQGITFPGQPEQEIPHTWKVGFGLSASLTLTTSLFYGIKHTLLDYESGIISLDMAERNITKNVKTIFYNLLLMEESIALMKQNIEAAEDRYQQAVSNYNNGLVSEYVMLSTQVAYENMKPGLKDLLIGYDTLLLSFKQLLGVNSRTGISLKGSIEPKIITLDMDEAMSLIEEKSEVQLQGKMLEILKNTKALKRSMLYPAFTMMFSYDPTFQGDPFSDPWFDNFDEDWSQYSGRVAFVITIPVDGFIPRSKSQVDIAGSNDAIKQAELGLIQIKQAAELEVESTFMKLQKSQEALGALILNVDLAERAYNLAEEAYNAGSKELLEVRNSELELNNARLEVLKEKYNYIMALLDLEYSLHITLVEENDEK